jgi:hypothetical protein
MGSVTVAAEESLPAALDRLSAAVESLVDPIKVTHDGAIVSAPSLYEQLIAAIPGGRGELMGRRGCRAMAPLRTDALDLRIEIDNAVRGWLPEPGSTAARLRALAAKRWRPQDTGDVVKIAARIESWSIAIDSMLNPAHVRHVSAPCPACGAKSAFRRDAAGETVRVPALQIVTERGCTCLVCRHTWGPELYLHLARVLGFETPAGVIE